MILSLVLVVVLGSVAGALATYASVGLRQTVVIRDGADLRAGAEAGLRYGLERLQLGQTVCNTAASASSATIPIPPTFNGRSVTLTCSATAGTTADANAWAVIVTGVGLGGLKSLSSLAGAATTKTIGGPLYVAVPTSTDLKSPVAVENGDLWYPDGSSALPTPPTIPNLTIANSPPRGKICTTSTWDEIAPSPALPPFPAVVDPPGRNDLDGLANCRVFFPGVYTSAPALDGENYFVSGDYYFSNFGVFDMGHAVVIGGRPGGVSLGDTMPVLTGHAPGCATALANPVVAAAETGTGVTWVLGGNSSINVGVQGELELFETAPGRSRRQPDHGRTLDRKRGLRVEHLDRHRHTGDHHQERQQQRPRRARHGLYTEGGSRVRQRDRFGQRPDAGRSRRGTCGTPSERFGLRARRRAQCRAEQSDVRAQGHGRRGIGRSVSVRAIVQMDTSSAQIAVNSLAGLPFVDHAVRVVAQPCMSRGGHHVQRSSQPASPAKPQVDDRAPGRDGDHRARLP